MVRVGRTESDASCVVKYSGAQNSYPSLLTIRFRACLCFSAQTVKRRRFGSAFDQIMHIQLVRSTLPLRRHIVRCAAHASRIVLLILVQFRSRTRELYAPRRYVDRSDQTAHCKRSDVFKPVWPPNRLLCRWYETPCVAFRVRSNRRFSTSNRIRPNRPRNALSTALDGTTVPAVVIGAIKRYVGVPAVPLFAKRTHPAGPLTAIARTALRMTPYLNRCFVARIHPLPTLATRTVCIVHSI